MLKEVSNMPIYIHTQSNGHHSTVNALNDSMDATNIDNNGRVACVPFVVVTLSVDRPVVVSVNKIQVFKWKTNNTYNYNIYRSNIVCQQEAKQ